MTRLWSSEIVQTIFKDYYGREFQPKIFESVFHVSKGRLTPSAIFGVEDENIIILKSFNGIAVERVVPPESLIVPSSNVPHYTRIIAR